MCRRVRAMPIGSGDVVLAMGLLAFALAELVGMPQLDRTIAVPAALAMTVPLLWRRRAPVAVVGIVLGAFAVQVHLGIPENAQLSATAALVIACFSVGAHAEARPAVGGLALAALLAGLTVPATVSDIGFVALVVGGSWSGGRVVRASSSQARAQKQRAEQVVAASDDRARQAAEDERRRIARELHDIVAHSLSLMVVQAGGAQHVVRSEPDRAVEAFVAIQQIGRQSLVEMKRLLGILRAPEGDDGLQPPPTLHDVTVLVEQMRATGMSVELNIQGSHRQGDEGVELSIFRIVQEALTNVIKHAEGTRACVDIRYTDLGLYVDIVNDGATVTLPTRTEGKGLVGMRERTQLLGGELFAAPRPGGGFRVRGRFPFETRSDQ